MKKAILLNPRYRQVLFVAAAFAIMVGVSYWYVKDTVQQQMEVNGSEVMSSATATVRMLLSETEVSLANLTFAMEDMVDKGYSVEAIEKYLVDFTARHSAMGDRHFAFNDISVYGVVHGRYVDGNGWKPSASYMPTDRPWYVGAMAAAGGIFFTAPYVDAETGQIIITVSRQILGKGKAFHGVLAIDFDISAVTKFIGRLKVAGGGYGFLLNDKLEIVSHKNSELQERPFAAVNESFADVTAMVARREAVLAMPVTDHDGTASVLFLSPVFNDWYVGVITPVSVYYGKIRAMAAVLSCLGLVLTGSLTYLLNNLYAAKEKADEQNQSKSNFLARMSHEIRTPMNAIVGMAELILRDSSAIPKQTCSQALAIRQASANLLSIINDLLDLSKIESGKLEVVSAPYIFSSLINDAVSVIRVRLRDKPIRFVVNIASRLPNNLIGDEVRVRQVLLNLLSNAAKYTNSGFVALRVSFTPQGEDSIRLTLSVADSGVGIKEENLHKLFGDFVQLDMNTNRGIEGTGLGLAIARSLSRAMGGDITVVSHYGKGSTFTFTVPQRIQSPETFAAVENAARKHVLIYEPRTVYAQSFVATFDDLGVRNILVDDMGSFLEALGRGPYDVIFMPAAAYNTLYPSLKDRQGEARLALFSDDADWSAQHNSRLVLMPAHSLAVANVLNDAPDDIGYVGDAAAVRFTFPGASILVVDDIATNLAVAEGLLLPYDVRVDTAKSGQESLNMVAAWDYDLVFMDHMMPGMDGIMATQSIRKMPGKDAARLPIVALTANAVSGMKEMFLQHDMNDFLAKPIELSKLNAILLKWLPEEKRARKTNNTAEVLQPTHLATVPGLDMGKGIEALDGKFDAYYRVLGLYHDDAMDQAAHMARALQSNDLKAYTLCAHSLKSTSRTIGADELSAKAAALETSAIEGNEAFLKEHTSPFLKELAIMAGNIKMFLEENP